MMKRKQIVTLGVLGGALVLSALLWAVIPARAGTPAWVNLALLAGALGIQGLAFCRKSQRRADTESPDAPPSPASRSSAGTLETFILLLVLAIALSFLWTLFAPPGAVLNVPVYLLVLVIVLTIGTALVELIFRLSRG